MTKESSPVGGLAAATVSKTIGRRPDFLGTINLPAAIAAIVWSGVYPGIKLVLADVSPLALAFVRTAGSAVLLLLILGLANRRLKFPGRADWPLLLPVSLATAANQLLFVAALDNLTASHTVMIYGATPLLVIVIAWVIGEERPRARVVAGVLVSLLGIGLIVSQAQGGLSAEAIRGDLLAFAAMFAWALATVFSAPLLKRMPPLEALAYWLTIAAVMLLPFTFGDILATDPARIATVTWLALAYVLATGNTGGTILWNLGIRKHGPTQTMLYINLQPLCGVFFSVLLLGDRPALLQIVGSLIVIGGIFIARARG